MRRFYLLIAMVGLAGCEATPSANPGPFEQHILDGIAVNEARKDLYSDLTEGRSKRISKILIHQQKVAVGIAQEMDKRADLSSFFVSMTTVPEFRAAADYRSFDPQIFLESHPWPNIYRIRENLGIAARDGGFKDLVVAADYEIQQLAEHPHIYCMLRHFLESIRRAAFKATDENSEVAWEFIQIHLRYLGEALDLDKKALPFQAKGIPILCQDVPPIPLD